MLFHLPLTTIRKSSYYHGYHTTYLEDYVDGRAFWPMEIWNKYSPTGDLGYFANPTTEEAKNAGLACLDELITDALD